MDRGILEAVASAAEVAGPDAVAVETLEGGGVAARPPLTYRALLDESARVASGFTDLGLCAGDTVAVFLPNVAEWLVTELAAARVGLRVAPINTKYRSSEVARILGVGGVRAAVVATGFLSLDLVGVLDDARAMRREEEDLRVVEVPLAPSGGRLASVRFDEIGSDAPASFGPPDLDRPLNLLFSSGTTSSPKVVAHSQRALMLRLPAAGERFDIHPGDVVLCALPLCGAWGLGVSLTTLLSGARLLLAPVFDGDEIARAVAAYGVTHFHGADDMVRAILDAPALQPECTTSWRSATFGNFSGRDPGDLVVARPGMGHLEISGAYGSSEAAPFVSADPPGTPAAQRVAAGGPLVDPTTEARVVDPDTGEECAVGEIGELLLRGPVIATEYVDNPEATAEAFGEDGWFRTGDLARIEDGDRVVFIGRLKDSLRLRGFLVDPGEIEEFLIAQQGVVAAQVVGVDDPVRGELPVAFVVGEPDGARDLESRVLDACRSGLAAFKVPVAVVVVDEFPVVDGVNGRKVKRNELRERAQMVISS